MDHIYADGKLWTTYDGYRTDMETYKCSGCITWKLKDTRGIETKLNSYWPIKDNNNNWVEPAHESYASAHYAVQRAWDYFFHRHGRWDQIMQDVE